MSRQNIYDEVGSFARYQQLRRSSAAINEPIEQPAVRRTIGTVRDARAIDLGCGRAS